MSEHARTDTSDRARVYKLHSKCSKRLTHENSRVAQLMYQTKPTSIRKEQNRDFGSNAHQSVYIHACAPGDLEVRISALGLMWYVSLQVKTPRVRQALTHGSLRSQLQPSLRSRSHLFAACMYKTSVRITSLVPLVTALPSCSSDALLPCGKQSTEPARGCTPRARRPPALLGV